MEHSVENFWRRFVKQKKMAACSVGCFEMYLFRIF
jgi:hypothetical protein